MPCTAPAAAGVDAGETRTFHALVLDDYPHPAVPGPRRRGLFEDTETTGFDHERDRAIELAMLPSVYSLEGHITDVPRGEARTWRQDPGPPVPPEITRITSLSDQDLEGQAIDVTTATELVTNSHLVIAHSAGFDRPFVETVVPAAQDAAWACSLHEVRWDHGGFPRTVRRPHGHHRLPPFVLPRYNTGHRYAGIAMLTPHDVHYARTSRVLEQRERTLRLAWNRHPERFVNGAPKLQPLPQLVWINPPAAATTPRPVH